MHHSHSNVSEKACVKVSVDTLHIEAELRTGGDKNVEKNPSDFRNSVDNVDGNVNGGPRGSVPGVGSGNVDRIDWDSYV